MILRCFISSAIAAFALLATTAPVQAQKVAQRWAVLIGVDDYANANDLTFCGADQTALRDRLLASGFAADNIFLLYDKAEENKYRPSQRNIEQQLRLVINNAEADDLLVVAFSGHGVSLAGKSYLCPNDATLDDPATLISLDTVYDRLRNCAARFKLVVVDACRNDPSPGGKRSFSATEGTKQLARSLQELRLPEGVVLLNSCAPGEVSWEEQQFGHGVYMNFVLEAMNGAADENGDKAVSLNELQRYAGGKTRAYVARRFNESQRPFYRSEGESEALDFALLPVGGSFGPSIPGKMDGSEVRVTPKPVGNPPPSTIAPFDATTAKQHQEAWARHLGVTPESTSSIGMKLMLIPPGEFTMGSGGASQEPEGDFRPKGGVARGAVGYRVRITKPYFVGKYEVTQAEWQTVMQSSPWRNQNHVREEPTQPAVYITWQDATEFCRTLSAKEGKTYRLPTEAEWEYACRAGTTTKYYFGNDEAAAKDYETFTHPLNAPFAMSLSSPQPVGQKRPNPWGLHDLLGNLSEWCQDGYQERPYRSPGNADPVGPHADTMRVQRGGNWALEVGGAADRDFDEVDGRSEYLGFRVVREF